MKEIVLPESYLSVKELGKSDFIEKKSRFLGFASSAMTNKDAEIFIKKIHGEYPDCSAVLYGYICGYNRNIQKYFDSHEPQGGMAILDSIKKRELTGVVCVVLRYYGGVQLGAGPLGRAFGRAASLALDNSLIMRYYKSFRVEITMNYSYIGKVEYFLKNSSFKILSKVFSESVILIILTKQSDLSDLKSKLNDMTSGNMKCKILNEQYSPHD